MDPVRVKIIAGAVAGVVIIGGLTHLATKGRHAGLAADKVAKDDNDPNGSKSRSHGFNTTTNSGSSTPGNNQTAKASKQTATGNDLATSAPVLADVLTTNALGETEAETRERERYETAQRNAFKYRKLDPTRIKPTELAPAFDEASKKYNVPKDLLAALAYVETGGTHRDGANSIEAGYGVMNLRESNLVDTAAESASIIGKTKEDVFYDQKLNIEAAAALLQRYYEDALATGVTESEAWYMAVSTYSGRPNPELAAAEADEVAGMLIKGFEANLTDGGGSFSVPANPNPLFLPKNWKLAGVPQPTLAGGGTPPSQPNSTSSQ